MGRNDKLAIFLQIMEECGYSDYTVHETQRWLSRYLRLKKKRPRLSDLEVEELLKQTTKSPTQQTKLHKAISTFVRYVSTGEKPIRQGRDRSYLLDEKSANWAELFEYTESNFAQSTLTAWRRMAYNILELKMADPQISYDQIIARLSEGHGVGVCERLKHIAGQMSHFETTGACLPKLKHSVKRIHKYDRMTADQQDKWSHLLTSMTRKGYKPSSVKSMRDLIGRVMMIRKSNPCVSYEDVAQSLCEGMVPRSQAHIKGLLHIMKAFEEDGTIPSGEVSHFMKTDRMSLLTDEFGSIVHKYKMANIAKGHRKESRVNEEVSTLIGLMLKLQDMGLDTLEEIKESDLISLLSAYTHPYSARLLKNAMLASEELPECRRVAMMIPIKRRKQPNIPRLTQNEVDALKQVLSSQKLSSLSLRDKAIGMVALFTALRRCDIVAMKLEDIDWVNETITVQQQKTSIEIVLPLRPNVGNAIYEYIRQERPNSPCREIFLSTAHQHLRGARKMQSQSLYDVSSKIFKSTGIRQGDNDRKGMHLFRHNLATSMLEKDVPLPVIIQTMGHTSPNSVMAYLGADLKHLKECALSIEDYPVRKGVFDD